MILIKHHFPKLLICIFLLITACNKQENITSGNNSNNTNNSTQVAEIDPNTGCLKTPGELSSAEEINLQETVAKSGQLTAGKYIGYTFEGKKGQKLNYTTPNDICLWIFQPDTKLLEGVELPIDGKYTIQISLLKGSSTFDLEMSLQDTSIASNSSNNQSDSNSNLVENVKSIGWIRIGAVNGDNESYVGQPMIKTTQPVTIAPTNVPNIGDKISIITTVNLRDSFPKYPNYDLPNSISTLSSGQQFIILNLETFVDYNSSPNRIIWAEIGLK
ncbi:hypothetical protein GM3708_2669 [Geminocystis sp. NIES-3708]|uniref:hypothetical protein n=1 Tax=Geminocystis sp. NIES-3708 TaxID=1615909 RepID=UPI0005FCD24F|nr:hypothetical protein [Geminocystis sp. NIES-3708]BAQ62263.1 hypothetical protein GM3708_2669 [Geminocystis sp. NIES-3708]